MFNKEQKETFIKEYLRSKVVAETSLYAVFKKTEDFEEKLNYEVDDGRIVINGNTMTIKIISNSWQKIHYVV